MNRSIKWTGAIVALAVLAGPVAQATTSAERAHNARIVQVGHVRTEDDNIMVGGGEWVDGPHPTFSRWTVRNGDDWSREQACHLLVSYRIDRMRGWNSPAMRRFRSIIATGDGECDLS